MNNNNYKALATYNKNDRAVVCIYVPICNKMCNTCSLYVTVHCTHSTDKHTQGHIEV